MILHHSGFPIRKSAGWRLFAANRSLSQLVTSFVGSWCQGIRPVLFIAWTSPVRLLELSLIIVWIVRLYNENSIVCFPPFYRWNCSFPTLQKNLYFFHLHDLDLIFIISFLCWLSVRFTLQYLLYLVFNDHRLFQPFGGLKWTRTTDLALIRRAL